jgi:transcriptional regulator with XRE-family HTH domain
MNKIGKALKKLREKRGLTQTDVGKVLGYTRGNVSHLERGARGDEQITVGQIRKMSQLFGCAVCLTILRSVPFAGRLELTVHDLDDEEIKKQDKELGYT